jgi:hypothetical protein
MDRNDTGSTSERVFPIQECFPSGAGHKHLRRLCRLARFTYLDEPTREVVVHGGYDDMPCFLRCFFFSAMSEAENRVKSDSSRLRIVMKLAENATFTLGTALSNH